MSSFIRWSPLLGFTAALVWVSAAPARAQLLTDATLFRTDVDGNTIQEGWNTRGGDAISNLYLLSGPTFLNSGDSATASISLDLSAPGVYTFGFAGDNVNNNTAVPLALNLFFNGATTPDISVRGPQSGGFFANGGITNSPTFSTVNGANTLTLMNGSLQIALTGFSYQTTGGPNLVSSFNNVPTTNASGDTNGSFTLTVSSTVVNAAPEPATLGLLAMGLASGIMIVRKRKA